MNNIIENNDDQFANGQGGCDLRGSLDLAESAPEEFPAPIGRLLGLTIISRGTARTARRTTPGIVESNERRRHLRTT